MKSSSTFSNIFFILLLAYLLIIIFLFFYQRKLLYHPGENNYLDDASLNHKIEKVYIPSDQKLVEIQISSESDPFERKRMDELLDLAFIGSKVIIDKQLKAVDEA